MGGPFPQDLIQTVRDASDITQVIADYVPLKQAGARLKGLCPFHQEKTPSFSVDPGAQLFYCFGCQTGGDVFKFVQLYEKVGFGESVEMLARRFGVQLPRDRDRDRGREADPADRVREMNALAAERYASLLKHPRAGAATRAYLEDRGLGSEIVEKLGIGHAADSWDDLRNHLIARRFKPAEIVRAGLALPRKSGNGEYDRFRGRLMFPIRDLQRRVVAFGGRALGEAEPKYINSPETPAYTKGSHLYGLDLARESIRREGFAVVVEGYLDLAALVQAGFDNVVASLGTAFTEAQARLLARFTERVCVSYDGDAAGAQATAKSLDLLLQRGFEVRVVDLPAGADPDDYIRERGADAYGALLRSAPTYLEFLLAREVRSRDLDNAQEKVAAVNAMLPHLAKLRSRIERASWTARLADALRIDDGLVRQELDGALRASRTVIRRRAEGPRRLREDEARLVSLLLQSDKERRRWKDELDPADLEDTEVAGVVRTILELARNEQKVDHATVLAALTDEADREILTRIAFRDEAEKGPDVEDCLCTCRHRVLQKRERQALREIGEMQQRSDREPDPGELDRQLLEIQRLARQRDASFNS